MRLHRLMVVLGVLLLASVGCTGDEPSPAPSPSSLLGAPTPPAVAPVCATELPAPWREALAEGVVEWEGDPGFVAAVAPDGSLLVRIWVPEVRNELWWHPVDGEPVLVHDLGFAYRNLGVVGADTDGRYVAYGLTRWDHGETWALYVWDSQAGAAPVPLIEFGPEEWGMLHPPIVHDGQVYWAHRAEGGSTTTL